MQEWWTASDGRRSSSRRSRSGWGSTRPTSATSTTTTCRRASSRTRRRSAAPAATASREHLRAARLPRRRADARELRLRRHADARGARRPARGGARRIPSAREFAVSEYELSGRHDLRPLVLKTVLTYLELDGVLRQGTPFYAGYRLRPLGDASLDEVFGRFDESRADFLRRLIATRQDGPHLDDARARRRGGGARRGAQPDRGRARVPRPAGPGRAAAGRRAPALHAPRPPRLRAPSSSSGLLERFARRERAETGADRERARARHPRRLPGERPRRLLRRDAHGAVRALQPLPDRARPAASRARAEAADRGESSTPTRSRRCATPSRRARHAETAGAIPRRHHEPGDEPREADQGSALRLARRAAVRRRARLVLRLRSLGGIPD